MMIADVTVVPKSGRFSIQQKEGEVKIFLRSAPEKDKANLELAKELSKALGCQVRILSGLKSRHKRLELDMEEKDWQAFLAKVKK